jgi:tetratricopeptide (TPR) repeat protein
MQNLRALREADLNYPKMRIQLREIENRLVTLHETQKASLLLEKAILLFYLEDYNKALDIAEESYSVAKLHGSDYPRQYHAMMVARYSRKAGNHNRTREVLDDYLVQGSSPYSKIQIWIEQIRLFLELQPLKIQEAVVVADNISRNLGALTTSRIRTEAFCEIGKSYLSAKMYNKGIEALCQVREISLNDHTDHRRYLLRKGLECLTDCKRISNMDSDFSPKISHHITQLNNELENAYGSSDP